MPIKARIDMLTTGIRTPVGMKVSGPDLKVIQDIAVQAETDPGQGARAPAAPWPSAPPRATSWTSTSSATSWPATG